MKALKNLSAVLAMLLCFSACNAQKNKSNESIIQSAASMPESALAEQQSSEFIKKDVLSLADKASTDIKSLFSGECCAYVAAMGAACLEYYNPFIRFLLAETSVPGAGGIKFAESPFEANTEILEFSLFAEYDAPEHKISNQDSLRLLFNSSEEITYELLEQKLKQSPELQHVSEAYYAPIAPFAPEQNNIEAIALINGGLYEADYIIDEIPLRVSYIKASDKYVAFGATVGKADFSKLSGK